MGVITSIQGVPVKNNTQLFLTKIRQGIRPINLTIIRSGPQEAQHSGASRLATYDSSIGKVAGQREPFWSAKHRILYYNHKETGEPLWELPTSRPSAPPRAMHNHVTLIANEKIRKHLGVFGGRSAEHYFSLFGEPDSGTAPFGSRVWDGIKQVAGSDAELFHYPLEGIRQGWSQAPQPLSKRDAQLPVERDQWWQMPYPAVFVKGGGDIWIVRCLAILPNDGKHWYTHWSRVTLITTDDDVIPPSLRFASAGAISASVPTASGTSTLEACSAANSYSGDDTDYIIFFLTPINAATLSPRC
ncbi:hypothetical protein N9L19_01405 [bacterium]|nr:hypothetical protein [bacterium]